MADRAAKEALFDELARIAKALGSGRRAEIVDLLANGERSVESIASELDLSVANASQHLQILRRAGLLTARRERTSIIYRVATTEVIVLWRALQSIARKQIAEVERLALAYTGELDGIELLTKEELAIRLRRKNQPLVLDVRPEEEYAAGHLPGAVSIPVDELEKRLSELPKSVEIVAYCRGPFCAFAPEAARYLKKKGYRVKALEEGLPDWRAAGLPLEG
ncbi:MAG: ArsR/SmtB family transcription factor [Actinomycetota bacterium]